MLRHTLSAIAIAAALAACSKPAPPPANDAGAGAPQSEKGFLSRQLDKAFAEARAKLERENIDISNGVSFNVNGTRIGGRDDAIKLPKAEITPQGDLLIEGTAVAITPAQRSQLLDYRGQIIGIAAAGMAIGSKGADIAGEALSGVAGAIFGGKQAEQDFEQRMEAKGRQIEAEAMKLCDLLPGLLASQQALAASLPEFQPYARMTEQDVDDCRKDEQGNGTAVMSRADGKQVRDEIREKIRSGIRGGVQSVAQATGVASAGTGDVATVNGVRFLLPPGGVQTDARDGETRIAVSNGLRVRLDRQGLWVNGERYPAPRAEGEVDLRTPGTVRVDGEVVTAR